MKAKISSISILLFSLFGFVVLTAAISAVIRQIAQGAPQSPPYDAKRIGVWSWEEGYISHILFRDDSKLWIYMVNPEGAALWELNLEGPSKKKLIPATFLDNFVQGPDWLANTSIAASQTRKHVLLWPNSPISQSPACILIRVEQDSSVRAVPLDVPEGFAVGCADFSFDDKFLAIVRHPAATAGSEVMMFDLRNQTELGVLKPVDFSPEGHPALIRRAKFEFASNRLWISAGIFKGEMFEPPLLVGIPAGKGDYIPLIQGNILPDGLVADSLGVSVLLDAKAAQGKTGVDPNNWWVITAAGRNAKKPSPLKGAFTRMWPFGDGYYAAIFRQSQSAGGYGEQRLILVTPDGVKNVFSNPRVAACSPSGAYIAAIKEGSNKLEVYKLLPKPEEQAPDA